MERDSTAETLFNDPDHVARYAEGPARLIPGFATLHRMVVQLLQESVDAEGRVLVLGAGGGLELHSFATAEPGWTFAAVDPSGPMLGQARRLLGGLAPRVEWVEGYIPDAPPGPFDAATCLLTLQMIREDAVKLEALRSIHRRLKPGAPFVIVDNCIDMTAPDADRHLERYLRYGIDSGGDPAQAEKGKAAVRSMLGLISAAREEALLAEAGFRGTELFFAGLSWRGWITYA